MSMKMKKTVFGAKKEFLVTVDHYVSFGHRAPQATSSEPGSTVVINDRRILRAGTIWKEDGVCIGLVADDYDLTDGDAQVAVVVHGFVAVDRLPVAPTFEEMAEMNHILFFENNKPVTVSAKKYIIDFTPVTNATYTPEDGYSRIVNAGQPFAFKVAAAASHSVTDVKVNGETIEADSEGVYTIKSVSADSVIVATIS